MKEKYLIGTIKNVGKVYLNYFKPLKTHNNVNKEYFTLYIVCTEGTLDVEIFRKRNTRWMKNRNEIFNFIRDNKLMSEIKFLEGLGLKMNQKGLATIISFSL
jgi:hypothetical protein